DRNNQFIFFFQAEDGIRDFHVTGVQTCALPILLQLRPLPPDARPVPALRDPVLRLHPGDRPRRQPEHPPAEDGRLRGRLRAEREIGRATCRERIWMAELVETTIGYKAGKGDETR